MLQCFNVSVFDVTLFEFILLIALFTFLLFSVALFLCRTIREVHYFNVALCTVPSFNVALY